MAKKLTSKKAKEILHDKSVHGKPLTEKQRRFFGYIASGGKAEAGDPVKPIYTTNPNDPRLKAYQDSLNLYNTEAAYLSQFRDSYTPAQRKAFYKAQEANYAIGNKIQPIGAYKSAKNAPDTNPDYVNYYKKPVQPVEYRKPEPRKPENVEMSRARPEMAVEADMTRRPNVERNKTEYSYTFPTFDKDVQKTVYFNNAKEVEDFANKYGYSSLTFGANSATATGTPYPQYQMGGSLPGASGMMYARTGSTYKKKKAAGGKLETSAYYQNGLDFEPRMISQAGSGITPDLNFGVNRGDMYVNKPYIQPTYVEARAARDMANQPVIRQATTPINTEATKEKNRRYAVATGKKYDEASGTVSDRYSAGTDKMLRRAQENIVEPMIEMSPLGEVGMLKDVAKMGLKGATGLTREALVTYDRAFNPIGKALSEIEKKGIAEGLSPWEIKNLQMNQVGITSNQRRGYVPFVSDFAEKYVTPYGYGGQGLQSKLGQTFQNILKGGVRYETGFEDFADVLDRNLVSGSRGDAWRLYLGKPQKNNTFRMASTSPYNHPAYTPEQLSKMDIYSINPGEATAGIKPYFAYPDLVSPYKIDNAMEMLRKPMTFEKQNEIMGGFNKRLNRYGLDYNDVWDLDPTITPRYLLPQRLQNTLGETALFNRSAFGGEGTMPRKIKVPVSKFFGKPFMSHEVIDYTTDNLRKDLKNVINFQLENTYKNYPGHKTANKLQGYLEEIENLPKDRYSFKEGGIIEDDMGQWAHPGKVTKIGSNNITMKGVPYPVLGISDTGDRKMMQPGNDYTFDGSSVTEYPMAMGGMGIIADDGTGVVMPQDGPRGHAESPNYVGEGYTTKGFNYNSAWGGRWEAGGTLQDRGQLKKLDQLTNFTNYNDMQNAKSGIRIAPEKKGTFTAAATKHGMGVQEFASHVLANPKKFSGLMRKKANFAKNAAKWKHEFGGMIGDIDNKAQGGDWVIPALGLVGLGATSVVENVREKKAQKKAMANKAEGGNWVLPAVGGALGLGALAINASMKKKRNQMGDKLMSVLPMMMGGAKYGAGLEPFNYETGDSVASNWNDPGVGKQWAAKAGMQLYTQSTMQNGGGVDANYNEMGGVTSMSPLPGQFYPNGMDMYPLPGKAMAGVGMMARMQTGGNPRNANGDADGEMARGQIRAMHQYLDRLEQSIGEEDNLEPWVNSKITLADDYLGTVADYMGYSEGGEEMEEGQEMEAGGGIPERYKKMGFTRVGQKKKGDGKHKWKVLAQKGGKYKIVQGGWRGMEDFSQHGSEKRKKNFWSRMGGRDSSRARDPFSPLYWHRRFGTWEAGGPFFELGGVNSMTQPLAGSVDMNGQELRPLAGQFDNSMSDITPLPGKAAAGKGMPDNPGFRALPGYVQAKIMANMASGGKMPAEYARARFAAAGNEHLLSEYGYEAGGKMPQAIAEARFKAAGNEHLLGRYGYAEDGMAVPPKASDYTTYEEFLAAMQAYKQEQAAASPMAQGPELQLNMQPSAAYQQDLTTTSAPVRPMATPGLQTVESRQPRDLSMTMAMSTAPKTLTQRPNATPRIEEKKKKKTREGKFVEPALLTAAALTSQLTSEKQPRRYDRPEDQAYYNPYPGGTGSQALFEHGGWIDETNGVVYPYTSGVTFRAGGEMIKRADGSYSRRGLWDNIRANKGSGKKPTKEMLKQERKIKAAEKKAAGGAAENFGEDYDMDYGYRFNDPNAARSEEFPMGFKAGGQMIRRKDGSYSRRGLWDNIRANKGSGRKPTPEMLKQERKIRAAEAEAGMNLTNLYYPRGGEIMNVADVDNPIARMGGNIRRNYGASEYEEGGELTFYDDTQGAQPISDNPYDSQMIKFNQGEYHGETNDIGTEGMPINYSGVDVEVEKDETGFKDEDGNFQVLGNMPVENLMGVPMPKNIKYKHMGDKIAKAERKANSKMQKGLELVNQADPENPYDRLKMQSGMAKMQGADEEFKNLSALRQVLKDSQQEKLDMAQSMGVEPMELFGKANYGKMIKAAGGYTEDPPKKWFTPFYNKKLFKSSLGSDEAARNQKVIDDAKAQRRIAGAPWSLVDPRTDRYMYDWNEDMYMDPAMPTPVPTDTTTPATTDKTKFGTGTKKKGTGTSKKAASSAAASTTAADSSLSPYTGLNKGYFTGKSLGSAKSPGYLGYTGSGAAASTTASGLQNAEDLISDAEPFDYLNLLPEAFSLATNQLRPAYMQKVTPELAQAYRMSFQNQLNKNNATFRAAVRAQGWNPNAMAILSAQKYAADQDVLNREEQVNQQLAADVYNTNRAAIYDARMRNIALGADQEQKREMARVNTNLRALTALDSAVGKIQADKALKNSLRTYENLYKFRFGKDYVAKSYNPAENWEGFDVIGTTAEGKPILSPKAATQKAAATKTQTKVAAGGNITKLFKKFK